MLHGGRGHIQEGLDNVLGVIASASLYGCLGKKKSTLNIFCHFAMVSTSATSTWHAWGKLRQPPIATQYSPGSQFPSVLRLVGVRNSRSRPVCYAATLTVLHHCLPPVLQCLEGMLTDPVSPMAPCLGVQLLPVSWCVYILSISWRYGSYHNLLDSNDLLDFQWSVVAVIVCPRDSSPVCQDVNAMPRRLHLPCNPKTSDRPQVLARRCGGEMFRMFFLKNRTNTC